MMKTFFLTIFLGIALSVNTSKAQDTLKIKQSAQLMANAFANSDFDALLDYTYPKVVAMGGGKEKMKVTISNAMNQMKAQGITFRSIKLGAISKVYKAGTELHCSIEQHLALNMEGGYITSISPLMCISGDKGQTWTFISAGDLNEGIIKVLFPDYNPEFVLAKASTPEFHKE